MGIPTFHATFVAANQTPKPAAGAKPARQARGSRPTGRRSAAISATDSLALIRHGAAAEAVWRRHACPALQPVQGSSACCVFHTFSRRFQKMSAAAGQVLTSPGEKNDLEAAAEASEKEPAIKGNGQPVAAPNPAAPKQAVAANLKAMSLVLVTLQTTGMVILTRFSRVGERQQYIVSSLLVLFYFVCKLPWHCPLVLPST